MKTTIIFSLGIVIGAVLHLILYPQNPVREVEVEKIVVIDKEVPTTIETKYKTCASTARNMLYSSWNGEPLEGTTPENTQKFIESCVSQIK